MDAIKIDNFGREHPNKDFPRFRSLSIASGNKIQKFLERKLGLSPDSSSLELVKELRANSSLIPDVHAESDTFNLRSTLLNEGIVPKGQMFINWYRFDQIDEISLDDLSTYFDDIWYPAADDIDIFDDSISWIMSIGYSGEVMILRFDERNG